MKEKVYYPIVERYDNNLKKYGDNHLSLEWPNVEDMSVRYRIMLDMVKTPCSLLDFGCGLANLYAYIKLHNVQTNYYGLDINQNFVNICKTKYPDTEFMCCDVFDTSIPNFDYIICNGIFNVKDHLSFDEMWEYSKALLERLFAFCDVGIAVNFTSKHVDWEVDKLFHLPMDMLAQFITKKLTRHFSMRQDYNLFEYTTYIIK
jgi:SAM-dependent methyltransferase